MPQRRESGKDEGGAAESPGAPAAQRSSPAPTGGPEQCLVPVSLAPPRPRVYPRQPPTGTERAGLGGFKPLCPTACFFICLSSYLPIDNVLILFCSQET